MAVVDALGREVVVDPHPDRVVSLCPSQTELLFKLGVGDRVVGVTKFCVHPKAQVQQRARVGGTKNVDIERVRALRPDLVLAEKEENTHETVLELEREFPVFVTDVVDVDSALAMITTVGRVLGAEEPAAALRSSIRVSLEELDVAKRWRVLYLIWREPWMAAGRDTYIDSVMRTCGFDNVVEGSRYPELTLNSMQHLEPDFVFLSSEPLPLLDNGDHGKETAHSRSGSGDANPWHCPCRRRDFQLVRKPDDADRAVHSRVATPAGSS